jgi:thioesterase domain-containing protein
LIKQQLETYLYTHIPLSKAMGIQVKEASAHKVALFAPFAPNINHQKTVFGGSLHAIATLACWSLLYLNLKEKKDSPQIVITESKIHYYAPLSSDFQAECLTPDPITWQQFLKMLHVKGKGRIQLSAKIYHQERLCVDYQGTFAALSV